MKKFHFRTAALAFVLIMFNTETGKSQLTVQNFSYTGSIQQFTVPTLCVNNVTIEARGAQGGDNVTLNGMGGKGAQMIGTFTVTPGQIMNIVVGQRGANNQGGNQANGAGGGGGGSFVWVQGSNLPLIVAGGGGGSSLLNDGIPHYLGKDASITPTATGSRSHDTFSNSPGGVNGADGTNICASGGKGWASVLQNPAGNPSGNVTYGAAGGYGGGGGAGTSPNICNYLHTAGGGGGYSGGGAGGSCYYFGGGGGGSYNIGTNQTNSVGVQSGDGLVVISYSLGTPITTTISPFAICSGSSATLTAAGMVTYTWSNNSNNPGIVVNPPVTTSYTVQGTNNQNCITTAVLTVTVSQGQPVLSVVSSTNQTCLGKPVTLTASGALSYTWTGGVTNGVPFTPNATSSYTVSGQNGCGTSNAVTTVTVAPLPISVSSTTNTVCAGSPATLIASSAATAYTWQPVTLFQPTIIVSPTVGTEYTVSASDGTCSGVATISLSALPVPTINVSASASMVCVGSSVVMSANGGITYTWMPGNLSGATVTVFPTGPTLYTISGVNSVGCITATSQVVVTNISPIVNATANPTLACPGQSVTLVAGGNAAGYQWTNGPTGTIYNVNPFVTTVYTVTGASANNTCTTTKTVEVNVFNLSITVSANPATVCSGSMVTLTASGADDYFWDNNMTGPTITVSPVNATTYSVSASSVSLGLTCNASTVISVQVNPNPIVMVSNTSSVICRNEKTVLHASGADTYTWHTNQTGASITVSPNIVTIHTYTVIGEDANGCRDESTYQVRVIPCTGVSENVISAFVNIFPNPSKGEFTISSDRDVDLKLVNELGQVIRHIRLDTVNSHRLTVSGLAEGIYFVTGKEGTDMQKRIIVLK